MIVTRPEALHTDSEHQVPLVGSLNLVSFLDRGPWKKTNPTFM